MSAIATRAWCRRSARRRATLNTHTRYLHDLVLDYIEPDRHLGPRLSQAILTCTGSEANDIALRMAQAVTGKTGIIATDNTYHGNTALVSALSTRRRRSGAIRPACAAGARAGFAAPGGRHLRRAGRGLCRQCRPRHRGTGGRGFGFSGMMLCPLFANEGLPDLAPGFLDPTVAR
jgi:4-aminobutyrate aminotransferase-like enzyme